MHYYATQEMHKSVSVYKIETLKAYMSSLSRQDTFNLSANEQWD